MNTQSGRKEREVYEFGAFRLDLDARLLYKDDVSVPLSPKGFEALAFLVRRAGEAIPRQELLDALWPDAVVGERNLDWNIAGLRRALGDRGSGESTTIETVRGFGYRFVAPVTLAPGSVRPEGPAPVPAAQSVAEPSPATRRRRRAVGPLIALLAAALLAAVGMLRGRRTVRERPPASRPKVAILGFENLSSREEAAYLSTAFAQMLGTEIAAGEKLRTVPEEEVARARAELAWAPKDTPSRESLGRVRSLLDADLVVTGAYAFDAGASAPASRRLRLDVRVTDAATGDALATLSESGPEADLFRLVSAVGARLRERLGAAPLSIRESRQVKASLPSSPQAAKLYASGLAKLHRLDAIGARDLLLESVRAEPEFPLAHAALAEAWEALGYDAEAARSAARAVELSQGLAREHRLAVEARAHASAHDWSEAAESYEALFGFFPDSLDYGLKLTQALIGVPAGRRAAETIEALRKLPVPDCDDPRIDLADAMVAGVSGRHEQVVAAAERAAAKGRLLGRKFVVAEARYLEAQQEVFLGDFGAARAACEEGESLAGAVGDAGLVSRSLTIHGDVLAGGYENGRALEKYEQSLAIARRIGFQREVQENLAAMAAVLTRRGDLGSAGRLLEEALRTSREVRDARTEVLCLVDLGAHLALVGDLDGAERTLDEAAQKSNERHMRKAFARALKSRGDVLRERGALIGALAPLREAVKMQEEGGFGALADARESLAALFLAAGRFEDADRTATAMIEKPRSKRDPAPLALAYALRAEARAGQGKKAEVERDLQVAMEGLGTLENEPVRWRISLAKARVLTALGRRQEARTLLEGLRDAAARAGAMPIVSEARRALGPPRS